VRVKGLRGFLCLCFAAPDVFLLRRQNCAMASAPQTPQPRKQRAGSALCNSSSTICSLKTGQAGAAQSPKQPARHSLIRVVSTARSRTELLSAGRDGADEKVHSQAVTAGWK